MKTGTKWSAYVSGLVFVLIALGCGIIYGCHLGTAAWLTLTSTHKLIWGRPVIGLHSNLPFSNNEFNWNLFYSRQLYGNAEIALLGLLRTCYLEVGPCERFLTSTYLWSGVAISVRYIADEDALAYKIHDAIGLLLALWWLYRYAPRSK